MFVKNTGRPTDDPKETTIKLRLSTDMRQFVEEQARNQGITLSEYIRNIIAEKQKL